MASSIITTNPQEAKLRKLFEQMRNRWNDNILAFLMTKATDGEHDHGIWAVAKLLAYHGLGLSTVRQGRV